MLPGLFVLVRVKVVLLKLKQASVRPRAHVTSCDLQDFDFTARIFQVLKVWGI